MKVWADVDMVHGPLSGALSVHESQDVIKDRMTRKNIMNVDDINEYTVVKPHLQRPSHFTNFKK